MPAKIKNKYYGLEFIDMPRDERPYYCRFAVHDAKTGECLLEFFTNKALEGYFVCDSRGNYRQIRGTCQYSLAGLGEKAVYNRLRIAAMEAQAEKAQREADEAGLKEWFDSEDYQNCRNELEREIEARVIFEEQENEK